MNGMITTPQATPRHTGNAASSATPIRGSGENSEASGQTFSLTLPSSPALPSGNETLTAEETADTDHPQKSDSEQPDELTVLVSTLSAPRPDATPALTGLNGFAQPQTQGAKEPANSVSALQSLPTQAAQTGLLQTQTAATATLSGVSMTKASPVALDGNLLNAVSNELNQGAANPLSPLTQAVPASSPAADPNTLTTQNSPEWAAVRVDTHAAKWGEQMLHVLHDRITLQAQQNLHEAKIRLDPPDLGKLDLVVRVEGDRLSVQIHANSAATREALVQVSDRLRAELQEQNFVHVDVNVGSGQREQQQSQTSEEQNQTIFTARELSSEPGYTPLSEHWLNTRA